jgi:RNA polymerase sigma factor (sigma-70 family)
MSVHAGLSYHGSGMAPTLAQQRAGKGVASQRSEPQPCCLKELDELFKRYHAPLSRLCAQWARGNPEDAQDLLAEAYLRAICATERGLLPADNPIAWLSSIIGNLARDQQRARIRRAGPKGDEFLETVCDPNCGSEALMVTREQLSETLHHVQSLGPAKRFALMARSAGESYEAIAAQLGTSPANARKLVQTARGQLRIQLLPLKVS